MGLFRLLIYAFLIYSVYRLVRIIVLPLFFRGNQFGDNRQDNFTKKERKRDGETTVTHIPKNTGRSDGNRNEDYVDYEEVE